MLYSIPQLFVLFCCWPACVNMEKELTSTAGQLLHTNKAFPAFCQVEQAQTQGVGVYRSQSVRMCDPQNIVSRCVN